MRELDRAFTELRRRWDRAMRSPSATESEEESGYGEYPVDISEEDDHITVEAELPGFRRDQIDVSVRNGILVIDAERKEEKKKSGATRHLGERRFTRVHRALPLPAVVDESKAEGRVEDGVLTLRLPKTERSKSRRIEIR
jgi:HSP20 family protein